MRYVMVWVTMVGIAATIYRGEETTAGLLGAIPSRACRMRCISCASHWSSRPAACSPGTAFPSRSASATRSRRRRRFPMVMPFLAIGIGGVLMVVMAIGMLIAPHEHREGELKARGHLMITLSASFVIFLVIGVPIALCILLASAVGLVSMDFPLRAIPSRMFAGIDSFVLLAAPFYILTGELMSRGGITERLIALSMLLTRKLRAGTAYAAVVTALFFSGISGTAVGDAAALGQIFIRQMNKEGYQTRESAGLLAAGSILGPIIPPSVIMVIYASLAAGLDHRSLHRRLRPGRADRAGPLPSSSGYKRPPRATCPIRRSPRPALALARGLSTAADRLTLPVIIIVGGVVGRLHDDRGRRHRRRLRAVPRHLGAAAR